MSWGLIPGRGKIFISLPQNQTDSGAYPASYPVNIENISAWLNLPGIEADPSPPSTAKVIMVDVYLHSPIDLHRVMLN
jgi:hypothetical protein